MNEKELHLAVCDYIKLQYPKVIFTSDLSGLKLTIGMAVQVKKMRSGNGIPDILIFKPKIDRYHQKMHGLFIELKRDGEKLRKRDGSFKSEHIKEQFEMIDALSNLGYYADFAIGFDKAKDIIDDYMSLCDI